MKLEIKHLAPYLPHRLQCAAMGEHTEETQYDDKPKPQIFEMQGLTDISYVDLHTIGKIDCETFDIEDVIPILRPLSDLTKKIEVNGEKFIPIVELAKIEDNQFNRTLKITDKAGYKKVKYIDNENAQYRFGFYTVTCSFAFADNNSNSIRIINSIQLYQKLLEWHFDVFGLINKGLAIDINNIYGLDSI